MRRDPRVQKLQQLRNERYARPSGGYSGTRSTAYGNVQSRPRRRNTGRTLLSLLVFIVVLVAVFIGLEQYVVNGLHSNVVAHGQHSVTIVVKPANQESIDALGQQLQNAGVIANATLFHWYLRLNGGGSSIQAGPHVLETGMTMSQVVQALSSLPPAAPTIIVRIYPGWRAEQIAQLLASDHVASYDALMREIAHGHFGNDFLADRPAGVGVEGYLLPDDYRFRLNTTAHSAVAVMLDNFGAKVTPDVRVQAHTTYGSLYKALTIAAIVERESGAPEDDALIAGVFVNRLAGGPTTRLDADATTQYASDNQRIAAGHLPATPSGWWHDLGAVDPASIRSPYNTRAVAGLPPGPIAEASASTLAAVVHPTHSTYYYYWHKNGSHGKSIFCTLQQGPQCPGTPQ